MRRTDLLWILAYPIYQLIGTLRHEGSHALVALAYGGKIEKFVFWPSEGRWGYVVYRGDPPQILMNAAPYLVDALTFLVFFTICMLVIFKWRWLWINLVAVGIVSPLVNSAYNYVGGLDGNNDVGSMLATTPTPLVHAYFWMTLTAYIIGLMLVFTNSRMARATKAQAANKIISRSKTTKI